MAQITGRVFRCYEKEWPSKKPGGKPNKTYSIKLEDDPIYYRTPRPKFGDGERFAGIAEPGNVVRFDADPVNDTSAQINGVVTKVEETKAAAPPDKATGSAGALNASGSGSPAYSAGNRDASIQYQSSRKDALEFVSIAVTAGAVKLPAKEALKLQALEALVDLYTANFYADIDTKGAVARASGEEKEAAAEPAKTAGDEE